MDAVYVLHNIGGCFSSRSRLEHQPRCNNTVLYIEKVTEHIPQSINQTIIQPKITPFFNEV